MRMSSSYSLRKVYEITFLILLGIYVLGLSACIPLSYVEPTPVFANHVVEETNGLTELWSRDDVYVMRRDKALDVSMGIGCFIGDLGKALKYDQITCFESETGKILWKKEEAAKNGLLAATPIGVFVAHTGFHNTLSRYDLQSGNLIWRKKWYESNPTDLLFFDNQIQLSTWKPGQDLRVFDTDGNVLKFINNTDAFLTTPDVTYLTVTGLQAVRTGTNDILWEHIDTGLSLTPMITQDKILCRSESNSGMAYALDRKTGELLWQVRDIVYSSSLAYSSERQLVYALNNNGDLLAIDENTGETNIAAKFSSTPFLLNVAGTAQAYELAYDQKQHILLVSLGDSHQLYAFREE